MNTLAFIFAGSILGLIVLAKIPGLEHTVRPMIDLLFTGIKAALENGISWGIWLFKVLWDAHWDLLRHLVLPPEAIDPSVAVKDDS